MVIKQMSSSKMFFYIEIVHAAALSNCLILLIYVPSFRTESLFIVVFFLILNKHEIHVFNVTMPSEETTIANISTLLGEVIF